MGTIGLMDHLPQGAHGGQGANGAHGPAAAPPCGPPAPSRPHGCTSLGEVSIRVWSRMEMLKWYFWRNRARTEHHKIAQKGFKRLKNGFGVVKVGACLTTIEQQPDSQQVHTYIRNIKNMRSEVLRCWEKSKLPRMNGYSMKYVSWVRQWAFEHASGQVPSHFDRNRNRNDEFVLNSISICLFWTKKFSVLRRASLEI